MKGCRTDTIIDQLRVRIDRLEVKLAAAEAACREALALFALGEEAENYSMHSQEPGDGWHKSYLEARRKADAIEAQLRAVLAGEGEARP